MSKEEIRAETKPGVTTGKAEANKPELRAELKAALKPGILKGEKGMPDRRQRIVRQARIARPHRIPTKR